MTFNHFLLVGLGIPQAQRTGYRSATRKKISTGNSHIEITFDGYTQQYQNVDDCQFTERATSQFWYLDVGFSRSTYLSIALGGDCQGTFLLDYNQVEQNRLGIVTYASSQFIYSSYSTTAWATSKPVLTDGQVTVERFNHNRLAELSFNATLLALGSIGSQMRTVPISGYVSLNRN